MLYIIGESTRYINVGNGYTSKYYNFNINIDVDEPFELQVFKYSGDWLLEYFIVQLQIIHDVYHERIVVVNHN